MRNNKAFYPKIYATYIGVECIWPWDKKYVFQLKETEEIIKLKHISRSGSTPNRVRKEWWAQNKNKKAKDYKGELMPIGTVVKMYRKEGSWWYRHLGE